MKRPQRLRHYFTHYQTLGGVQSIIKTHLKHDPEEGYDSSLLAFFDPATSPQDQVEGLGLRGQHTIAQARRRFAAHEAGAEYDIPIFHDLWGLAFLGEFDRNPFRRLGAVHSQWPHLDYQLEQLRGTLDGIFCDSQAIVDFVLTRLPELAPDRVQHLPVPTQIAPAQFAGHRQPLAGRPLVLGFVGRLDFAQKRVERFPALLQHLTESKLDCELHFLGTGSAAASLPGRFPQNAPVHFHGRQTGDRYWEIMSQWDFVVYTSDHEGSPLAMIEAMSAGNIPIFPEIGSGGDLVVREIAPSLLYPPEQWNSIASTLKEFQTRSPESIEQMRSKCRELSLGHSQPAYHRKFTNFLESILSAPKISQDFASPRRFHWSDHLPFGLLSRAYPRGFFRSNDTIALGDTI